MHCAFKKTSSYIQVEDDAVRLKIGSLTKLYMFTSLIPCYGRAGCYFQYLHDCYKNRRSSECPPMLLKLSTCHYATTCPFKKRLEMTSSLSIHFCLIHKIATFLKNTYEISRTLLVKNGTGVRGCEQKNSEFQQIWSAQMT